MFNLFVYGSLMFDEVWRRVVQHRYTSEPGQLRGFDRRRMRNEDYPGLARGDGCVEGVIRNGIRDDDLVRLDRFEGKLYERIAATAIGESGRTVPVQVYLTRAEYEDLLAADGWDPEQFAREGLHRFMARYAGFD